MGREGERKDELEIDYGEREGGRVRDLSRGEREGGRVRDSSPGERGRDSERLITERDREEE